MNSDTMTRKAMEGLSAAAEAAVDAGNQQLTPLHLVQALLQDAQVPLKGRATHSAPSHYLHYSNAAEAVGRCMLHGDLEVSLRCAALLEAPPSFLLLAVLGRSPKQLPASC